MRASLLCGIAVAVAVRLALCGDDIRELISARPEVVTANTSIKRIREGVFLWENGASPYAGDAAHAAPFLLFLFFPLVNAAPHVIAAVYTMLDVTCALLMRSIAAEYMDSQEASELICLGGAEDEDDEDEESEDTSSSSKKDKADEEDEPIQDLASKDTMPDVVALVYLLNPYSILCCVGMSTIVVDHIFVSIALLSATRGQPLQATIALALSLYLSPYFLLLVPPVCLLLLRSAGVSSFVTIVSTLLWLVLCLLLSFLAMGSWDFLAVYRFVFLVPDLAPNVGMFWYFFSEMFAHFKPFFLFVFHYHVILFPIPLAIRVGYRPLFTAIFSLGILAIFKPHPSIADLAFYAPFLLLLHREMASIRFIFHLLQVLLFVTVLAPIFWHHWIRTGAGNSNFFYGLTLAYNLGQILLLCEVLMGVLRYDKKGRKRLRSEAAKKNA